MRGGLEDDAKSEERERKWSERGAFLLAAPRRNRLSALWRLCSLRVLALPVRSLSCSFAGASCGTEPTASHERAEEAKEERLAPRERESNESLARLGGRGAPQSPLGVFFFFFNLDLFSLSFNPRARPPPPTHPPSLSRSRSLSLPSHQKNIRSASTVRPRTRPGPLSLTACSSASRAPAPTALSASTSPSCARPRSTPGPRNSSS